MSMLLPTSNVSACQLDLLLLPIGVMCYDCI